MDTVFKFCRKHGLEILTNLELKVTPPNQFNDPFEFAPKMVCSDPVGCAKRDLERGRNLEILYQMCCEAGKFLGSFPEFQEVAKKRMPEMIAIMAQAPQHTLPLVEKAFLDRVSERFGILCMSGRRDSILMWGHYCDKPLGLVIGFDKSATIFQQGKGLRQVAYVNERVVFDSCWGVGSPEMATYEDQIILCKGKDWSYENELRQMFPLSSSLLIKRPLKNSNSTPGYFLPFPPAVIVSITLGPRCSPELENEVGRILEKPCLAHVKRDRAVLHRNEFVLEFE